MELQRRHRSDWPKSCRKRCRGSEVSRSSPSESVKGRQRSIRTTLLWTCCAVAWASTCSLNASAFMLQPARSLVTRPQDSALLRLPWQRSTSPKNDKPSLKLSSTKSSNQRRNFPPRLTAVETKELLDQVVELRRIKAIQSELAMKSAVPTPPRPIVLAIGAGYDEDIDALHAAMDRGHDAREILVTRNMGLVHFCVDDVVGNVKKGRKRRLQSLSREDLVQEGVIGLARAVDRWNPEIGGKFSTYAVYWIRAAILRCIAERDDLVRVPEHVTAAISKMTKAARTLGIELDGEKFATAVYGKGDNKQSWEEALEAKAIAEEAGLTNRQLLEALKVRERRNKGIMNLDDGWMVRYESLVSSTSRTDQEENRSLSQLKHKQLKATLAQFLRPKELEALSLRYGLIDDDSIDTQVEQDAQPYVATASKAGRFSPASSSAKPPARRMAHGSSGAVLTFVEVGERMKISAEYGRRLSNKALEKLRLAAEQGRLEPALLMG